MRDGVVVVVDVIVGVFVGEKPLFSGVEALDDGFDTKLATPTISNGCLQVADEEQLIVEHAVEIGVDVCFGGGVDDKVEHVLDVCVDVSFDARVDVIVDAGVDVKFKLVFDVCVGANFDGSVDVIVEHVVDVIVDGSVDVSVDVGVDVLDLDSAEKLRR